VSRAHAIALELSTAAGLAADQSMQVFKAQTDAEHHRVHQLLSSLEILAAS
jgi:hypothetical protein